MSKELEEYINKTRTEIHEVIKKRYPEAKLEGKTLRGVLAVVVADCLNGNHQKAVEYGASVEMIHLGSLEHDDLLDEHLSRRGKPSSYITHGIKKAILQGDIYFSGAMKLSSEHGSSEAAEIATSMESLLRGVLKETSVGEVIDSIILGKVEDGLYLKIIDLKTAVLFGCAAKFGAMSFTDKKEIIQDFYNYGMFLGEAYQIADDIVDMISMADGKKDINPQNVAALVPAIIRYNKDFVKRIPFKMMTGKIGLDLLLEGFEELDLTDKMKADVAERLKQANMILDDYPDILSKSCLIKEFGDMCVKKMLEEAGEKL